MSPMIGPRHVAAVKALRDKFGLKPYLPDDLEMMANGAAVTADELVRVVLDAADAEDSLRKAEVGSCARCGEVRELRGEICGNCADDLRSEADAG